MFPFIEKLLSLLDFSEIISTGFSFIKYKRGKNSFNNSFKNEKLENI